MKSSMRFLVGCMLHIPAITGYSQGTVVFSNIGGGTNWPIYQADGVTKLSGDQFEVEMLAGPDASSLTPVTSTAFLSGAIAGYFDGGNLSLGTVLPYHQAWIQIDVWNTASGATFSAAVSSGLGNSWWQSAVFSVWTGGQGVNPGAPSPLTGIPNGPYYLNSVPEPSTLSLCLGGFVFIAGAGWVKRRGPSQS